jgi:hypothetical protein
MSTADRPARPKAARAPGTSATATDTNSPPIADVEELLATMNESDSLWLWRRAGDRWVFLESRPADALRALGVTESTRQRTGGGDYKARIRAANSQWGHQRMFSIDGEQRAVPIASPAAVSATPAATTPARVGEMPSWMEKIILPIGVALAAGITNKLLAEPKTDPLVLELLKLNAKGNNTAAGVDPLELQRTIMAAEERGESRGRELGELLAGGRGDGEGPLSAIREAAPLINRFLDRADAERRLPPANDVTPPASLPSSTAAPTSAPDIMPTWLRPFITYRARLLKLADDEKDATLYADVILDMAPDATLVAALQAHDAGVLEQDLLKAIPELAQTPARQKFTRELVAAIGEGLERMRVEEGESTSEGVGNG